MNKGQYSVEFMLVAAFSLLMVFVIINVMQSEYQANQDSIKMSQIDKVAREIVYNAERIYYQGKPSKITLEVQLPEKIRNINISQREITFYYESIDNIVEITRVSSVYFTSPPNYSSSSSSNLSFKAGIHYVTIEALDDSVNISG